ncbi:MAG: glycosyltransferase [Brockia lithotrophica]|nr:glycosyltransferase [Brockia lithotrophica]
MCPGPLGEREDLPPRPCELMHVAHALKRAEELGLDLLHNHMNYLPLPFTPLVSVPVLTTLHGAALLEADSRFLYRRYPHLPYVSISYAERQGAPELRYVANVYNGIDLADFTFVERPGSYLLFLGRLSPVKGPDLAIEVARRTGFPLKLAGPVPPEDREFFEAKIRPHVNGRSIEYVGEVGPRERDRLLGGALALLHLVRAPEPFGLVMVEAMATGTPVIGMARGSVPEVVEDGVTGFVVEDLEGAVRAVPRVAGLRRAEARRRVEERFTLDHMIEGYVRAYETVLAEQGER